MAEDDGTRRWQRLEKPARDADPIQAVRTALAGIRRAPHDPEARRRLHALGVDGDQLAVLLADEARAAADPAVAAAFYEELADVQENLDQPLEVIAAMERVVERVPTSAAHHDRLAWLYRRAGAWIKAAEAYERVAELAPDERGRAALRAAGKLYRDHGRLDRAARIYRQIVERRPSDADAWRALDELLAQLGRWREAADVRGERAARAKSGVDKAALLRSQARALEQAGEPAAAARLVAEAQQHAPDNVSGLVDYAEVLAREGKGREAAEILATRIDDAVDRGAPTDDVAALRLRLFEIYDEQLGDRGRAQMVMADLLAAAPEYLPALERMAARAARDPDPRIHAAALLRYAAALGDPAARGGAVLEAARRFRDAGDHDAAVATFEDAAELVDDPVVRRELEEARTAHAVAQAAAASRSGDRAAAEQRLRAILATRPANVEANLALAELLERAGKLDAAAEQLRDALGAAPESTPSERLAPLVHRFAQVMAALGDDDEAHQLLHEAHRLDRRSLPIQLALGESCFARKIWRQAALHLGALADHADTASHATAVARGLVHAAQAEVRALRPQNATKHYEAAVRIDPSCAPAWHALGEIAMERGDVAAAVDHLEREARATAEPRDRVRLFDALGDLALDVVGDAERAERCWSQIASVADASVLAKLVAVQRRRGTVRGETCERLAELVTEPPRKKALVEEAANAYLQAGELARATVLAERLVAAYPRDVDALTVASAVVLATGDAKRAATWLERGLAGDSATPADARMAELWRRLGDAKRALGDPEPALAAYRRAVLAAPESDGALGARRGLVALASAAGESAVTSRMALVEAEQDPTDILASARELAAAGDHADARHAFELALALGADLDAGDHRFLTTHPRRPMAADEAYAAVLEDRELRALVDDPDEGPLAELFELLAEAAPLLCAPAQSALVDADLVDATRISGTSDAAVAALFPQIAKALGGPATLLYSTARKTAPDVTLLSCAPPVVVFGPRLAAERARSHAELVDPSSATADAALRFAIGRVVELARPRRIFAALPREAFDHLVRGIRYAFGPAGNKVPRAVIAAGDRIRGATPVALRARISEWVAAFAGDLYDPSYQDAYLAAIERAADRAGLLACGDIGAALARAAGETASMRHLIELAASQRYLAARRKLRPHAVVEETTQPFTR